MTFSQAIGRSPFAPIRSFTALACGDEKITKSENAIVEAIMASAPVRKVERK